MDDHAPPQGIRTFVFVWLTQSISVLGSSMTFFTITLWLSVNRYPDPAQRPQLAWALALIGLARVIPTLLATPIAGVWADRKDRKNLMVGANLISGLLTASMVGLMLTRSLSVWALLPLQAGLAVAGAVHAAAFDTCYVALVPPQFLPRANGMMQTIWSLATILAPSLAALVIALPVAPGGASGPAAAGGLSGAALAIALDALSFFGVAALLAALPLPAAARGAPGRPAAPPALRADLKEGLAYIRQRPAFMWLLATFTIANFVVATRGVFQPLLLKGDLAADWQAQGLRYETALALLATCASAGGLAGGVAISLWGGLRRRRIYGVLLPMLVFSGAQLGLGLSGRIWVAAGAALLGSAAIPMLNAHSQAIWQTQTPRAIQGRVFAVRRVIAQCTLPLGTACAGLLGGAINPGHGMAILGLLMGLYCGAQLFNPALTGIEPSESAPSTAPATTRRRNPPGEQRP